MRPSDLVVDLKQKISLSEGVSIPEQQLLLDQNELWNETVIGQTGIQDGSLLHLMLVTPPLDLSQQTSYFTSCVNPSLSITHFKLGLNLEQLVGVASPRLRPLRQPLPPHIYHIVHMYDVPYHAWVELMYYLYSTQLTQGVSKSLRPLNVSIYIHRSIYHTFVHYNIIIISYVVRFCPSPLFPFPLSHRKDWFKHLCVLPCASTAFQHYISLSQDAGQHRTRVDSQFSH